MLDKYPHITQQQAWPWIWGNVDALYMFIDQIPTWVVDDSVMAIWASGRQDLPNSYTNWDSKNREAGMALMLSRVPSCLRAETDLQGEKVYSAVVMFVHPKQELFTIKEGAESLLQFAGRPDVDVTILCELPGHKYGRFYPSTINRAYLVLPYWGKKGKPKQLHLDLAVNSWFTACIGGMGNMVTWHSCRLYSQQILPFLSYFQLDTLARYGITTSTTCRLLQAVPEWWLYVPPSVGSHVAI